MKAVLSFHQAKSFFPSASNEGVPQPYFTGILVEELSHFFNSEWPSANEKELPPPWLEAGVSPHWLRFGPLMKYPSLILSGCSSRVTQVLPGLGTSETFMNCRYCCRRAFRPNKVGSFRLEELNLPKKVFITLLRSLCEIPFLFC